MEWLTLNQRCYTNGWIACLKDQLQRWKKSLEYDEAHQPDYLGHPEDWDEYRKKIDRSKQKIRSKESEIIWMREELERHFKEERTKMEQIDLFEAGT